MSDDKPDNMQKIVERIRASAHSLHFPTEEEQLGWAKGIEALMREPVAYGFPNTAITGAGGPLMEVRLYIPSDDQYGGKLYIPLFAAPPAPVVPEGMRLVPVEPSNDMLGKGWVAMQWPTGGHNKVRAIYQEMLNAAPEVSK